MKKYYFTFMQRQTKLRNKYVTFWGATENEAREKMRESFGNMWAFCYDEKGWIMDGKTQAEIYGLTEIK